MNLEMKDIPSVNYVLEKISFKNEVHESYLKK